MAKSWLEWTQENIARKCDPEGIARILLDNHFSMADVRSMMGDSFPQHAGFSSAVSPAEASEARLDLEQLRRKHDSIVEIRRSLAKLSHKAKVIERRRNLSTTEFVDEYYAMNRPVVLCELLEDWPALRKWTPQYLKDTCGDEMVEIMAGRNANPMYEIDEAPHRKRVPFSTFVDMVIAGGETNDYYLTARNDFFARPRMRALLEDFRPFPQYLKDDGTLEGIYFWFGPRGTITPLHHDLMNIFMAQVVGRKHVKLIPPDELDLVYNDHFGYSPVDCGKPDYSRFPKYRDATVFDLELVAGEVLFLPVGWWHYVRAIDISINVTFNKFLFPNEFEWAHPTRRQGA